MSDGNKQKNGYIEVSMPPEAAATLESKWKENPQVLHDFFATMGVKIVAITFRPTAPLENSK